MTTVTLDSARILANARALGPDIEAAADAIAAQRRLPEDLVAKMRAAGIFRCAFPNAWGGPEMDMVGQCELMEILAYHDTSAAWVAMICTDSGHYVGRLPEAVARDLYPHMDMLTSGALAPMGQAHRTPEGYRVTGRWPFGSGCLHADRIVGGCLVFEDGKLAMEANGQPMYRALWLPRDEVEIHDVWHTTGLAGTGSNDYSVKDVIVPEAHSFSPFVVGARPEKLYRYHGFFFANMSGVAIGVARRMIEEFRTYVLNKVVMPAGAPLKNEYRAQVALADATAKVNAAKAYQDAALTAVWAALERGEAPTMEERAGVGLMNIHAVQTAVDVSAAICEGAGTAALFAGSPFERRRRDILTMKAHVVAQDRMKQSMGQMLLGLETRAVF